MAELIPPSRMVGILGGMGPAATADFYTKLISATPAQLDQEHLRVVMWADPTVPNRHEALIDGGVDPTPWLEKGVTELMRCGAEIIVVPCNTVHAYLPAVFDNKDVEFISIIDTAVEAICRVDSGSRIGLLAADGALASRLYQRKLRQMGKEPVIPVAEDQSALMRSIYNIKAGRPPAQEESRINEMVDRLCDDGVTSLIAGCTELSLLFTNDEVEVPVVDPSQALVLKTIERARER